MITITRQEARRLFGVFRRSGLGIYHRAPVPPLVFRASQSEFRIEFQYGDLAVVYIEPGKETYIDDTIALPLTALSDIQSPSQTPVSLLAAAFERTTVIYRFARGERRDEYAVPAIWTLPPFPELPTDWEPCPAGLIVALTTFAKAYGDDTTTDLPNEGKRSPNAAILGRLLGDHVVSLGTTVTHFAFRSGLWTILIRRAVPPRVRTRVDS